MILQINFFIYEIFVIKSLSTEENCVKISMCAHYARLYKVLDESVSIELNNPAPDYKEVVETRYYESYNISGAIIPGIAKYYK